MLKFRTRKEPKKQGKHETSSYGTAEAQKAKDKRNSSFYFIKKL
jgi:hypothetical protein